MQTLSIVFCSFTFAVVASGIETPCDADDGSCLADASPGSMLMQKHHSYNKEKAKSATHHEHHHHAAAEQPLLSLLDVASGSKSKAFAQLAHRAAPNGFCTDHPCRATMIQSSTNSHQQSDRTEMGVGKTATLTQAGYEKVAALRNDKEMADFMVRVIDKYDCKVTNAGGFDGIVPWFSGTTITQSLPKLEDALLYAILADGKSWLAYKNSDHITGDTAAMNFVGYVQVAAIKSNAEMKKFARKVATNMGVKIVEEGGFDGMVRFYSGVDGFQSFERLQSEIKAAATAPHSWAVWENPTKPHNNVALFQAPTKSYTGFSLLAVRAPDGFCNGRPGSCLSQGLVQAPQPSRGPATPRHGFSMATVSKDSSKQGQGLGHRAALDQAGYAQVAALKSDSEMTAYITRMVDKYDCKVLNTGGLSGIVPWFSGASASQNIQKLEDTLLFAVLASKRPWLVYKNSDHINGETARLGFVGYVQVAAMRSDAEMQKYAKRVCKDMGVQVVDEGGFQGMVRFYSGTDNFQSYERLQSEIKSAANAPGAWAKWTKPPAKK